VVCGKLGTASATAKSYWIASMNRDKILSVSDLISEAQTSQSFRKRIVFTNGCYDIMHAVTPIPEKRDRWATFLIVA
jgi:bifunctional ADP-heptose synthase (sugar kinase/adenylyltransferase)